MGTEESDKSERGRQSKVARLLSKHELQGLGAELERLWTAEEDRHSLRDLAAYFNRQLLQQRLSEKNVVVLDGEPANLYRLLTDDGVSSAERTRVRRRLEREGIDVDDLLSDFVSYQAIRTYLTEHRDAEYEPQETDPRERETENIRRMRGRTVSVTEGKLEQLRKHDELTLGEFRTLVDIQVVCEECNAQYGVFELLDRGGCDCPQ